MAVDQAKKVDFVQATVLATNSKWPGQVVCEYLSRSTGIVYIRHQAHSAMQFVACFGRKQVAFLSSC
jgi:hypothetical protein